MYDSKLKGNLRVDKCMVYSPTLAPEQLLAAGLPANLEYRSPLCHQPAQQGIRCVGAPISASEHYMAWYMEEKVTELRQHLDLTDLYKSSQNKLPRQKALAQDI